MKTVEIVLLLRSGVVQNQKVCINKTTAEAEVIAMAKDLLGEDYDDDKMLSDGYIFTINKMLSYREDAPEIIWLTEIPVNDYNNSETPDPVFPNGFTDWVETHHQVVSKISYLINCESDSDNKVTEKIHLIHESGGIGKIWELAEDITNQFEAEHEGREWDGEYFGELSDFVDKKIMEYQIGSAPTSND